MNLLIRTDASLRIGTGHAMRSLALAQAWQDAGGLVVFAMAEAPSAIRIRLAAESCEVVSISSVAGTAEDASQTISFARECQADWIVVDGYQFNADFQRALKAAGYRSLFLDDFGHSQYYSADLVLNQNVGARETLYNQKEPQTRLLLGPRYALLRHEFAGWRDWKREVSPVCHRVLVMMGGSDPANLTIRVIEALGLAGLDLEATVVVGGSNPHFAMLQNAAAESGQNITVGRDADNVAELMATADVAISAAGSTCWELCLLGLPALLIDVAENQTALARQMDRRGCAIHVGDHTVPPEKIAEGLRHLCSAHELRLSLSRRSRELVDGKGARRVVSVLCGREGLRLRWVRREDSRLLWEWANDPEVRAASFSSDPISWETHVAWFAKRIALNETIESDVKIGSSSSLIWIAEDEEANPLGQIRFDARPDGDREVDVSIAPQMRGQGLASKVIRLGVLALRRKDSGARVHAFVKPANRASANAFERAGFRLVGTDQIRDHAAMHLIFDSE